MHHILKKASRKAVGIIALPMLMLTLGIPSTASAQTTGGTVVPRADGYCTLDPSVPPGSGPVKAIIIVDGSFKIIDVYPCTIVPGTIPPVNPSGTGGGTTTTSPTPTTAVVQTGNSTNTTIRVIANGAQGTTSTTDPGSSAAQLETQVLGEVITRDPLPGSQPAQVLGSIASTDQTLAFTGSDIAELAAIGTALIAAGGLSIAARRRRTANSKS